MPVGEPLDTVNTPDTSLEKVPIARVIHDIYRRLRRLEDFEQHVRCGRIPVSNNPFVAPLPFPPREGYMPKAGDEIMFPDNTKGIITSAHPGEHLRVVRLLP